MGKSSSTHDRDSYGLAAAQDVKSHPGPLSQAPGAPQQHGAPAPQTAQPIFSVTVNSAAQPGTVALLGSSGADLALQGYGNVVLADPQSTSAVAVHGGTGLSTVALGNGANQVNLKGAFNTVLLGNGDNTVAAGDASATVTLDHGVAKVAYDPVFQATLGLSGLSGHHTSGHNASPSMPTTSSSIGPFSAGVGNIGAFERPR